RLDWRAFARRVRARDAHHERQQVNPTHETSGQDGEPQAKSVPPRPEGSVHRDARLPPLALARGLQQSTPDSPTPPEDVRTERAFDHECGIGRAPGDRPAAPDVAR